jgi:enoyl-CoA hydratase/carnithine racemase
MTALVLREDRDGLATLTLNRPEKLNALNVELFDELEAHIREIGYRMDTVGCVVLRGAGRAFSAGNDLGAIAAGVLPPRPNFQSHVIEALANLPQPVICAIHGFCYTGALELALAGDLLVAASSTRFADTHGRFGLLPVWGMSQRLPRRVGRAKAKEIMFTSRTYEAVDALAMGLVDIVAPDEALDATVAALTRDILANSWHSNFGNKRLLAATEGLSLAAGLAHEIYANEGLAPDYQERIARFTRR